MKQELSLTFVLGVDPKLVTFSQTQFFINNVFIDPKLLNYDHEYCIVKDIEINKSVNLGSDHKSMFCVTFKVLVNDTLTKEITSTLLNDLRTRVESICNIAY